MRLRTLALVFTLAIAAAAQDRPRGQAAGDYQSLLPLHQDFVTSRQVPVVDGVPDYSPASYIAQLKRAIRIPCELRMQTGEFTLQQAIDHMVREVPLMEPDLARYDLSIYLRRPTYGMNYP